LRCKSRALNGRRRNYRARCWCITPVRMMHPYRRFNLRVTKGWCR
jgi:hypothetical protein